jgi:hypothetical protein
MKIYNIETVFTFGRYKGKSIAEVLKTDHDYITWCIMNVDNFILTEQIFQDFKDKGYQFHVYHAFGFEPIEIDELKKIQENKLQYKSQNQN